MARWAVPGGDGKEEFPNARVLLFPPVRRSAPLRWPSSFVAALVARRSRTQSGKRMRLLRILFAGMGDFPSRPGRDGPAFVRMRLVRCGLLRRQSVSRATNRLSLVTRAWRAGPSPAGDGKEGFAIAHLLVWRLCGARLRFAGRFSALRWSRSDARMARWAVPKARQGRIIKPQVASVADFAAPLRQPRTLARRFVAVIHLTPFGAALRSAVRPALFAVALRTATLVTRARRAGPSPPGTTRKDLRIADCKLC